MQKGIVLYSVLPVRAQAAESAEMTTQLLFGETCDIIGIEGRWALLETILTDRQAM